MIFPMNFTRHHAGPLLASVLAAEGRADRALRFPLLQTYADSVIDLALRLECPLLMAIGADGQRLLGAVELRCQGKLEQVGWHTSLAGRDVLLVGVAGVSGNGVSAAAMAARRLGAGKVHACSPDAEMSEGQLVDSFTLLSGRASSVKRRRTA